MARYVIGRKPERACGWVEHDYVIRAGEPMIPGCDVDSSEPADTGLITVRGEPIMRLANGIGFNAAIE